LPLKVLPLNPLGWRDSESVKICVLDFHSEQRVECGLRERLATLAASSPERGRFMVLTNNVVGETLWFARDIDELIAVILKRAKGFPASQEVHVEIDSPAPRAALVATLDFATTHAGTQLDGGGHRLVRARSRSVYIATPIARHPVHQYTFALAQTLLRLQALGIRAWVQTIVGLSNLARARNQLVAAFMASDFDDLLFIDDDVAWCANDVLSLLASDKDVIGGACRTKGPSTGRPDTYVRWCWQMLPGPLARDETGAVEVKAIGTGFMKISRPVFSRMKAAHPEWKRQGRNNVQMSEAERTEYYQYFRFDPNDPEETSEDYDFCRSWRELGGAVWIDPTIELVHVGEFEYRGDLHELLEQIQNGPPPASGLL